MADQSSWLKWKDGSQGFGWNVTTGCTPRSTGCRNCFATKCPIFKKRKFSNIQCHEDQLLVPLRRKSPSLGFISPRGDLLHEEVPDSFIYKTLSVVESSNSYALLLTKREDRLLKMFSSDSLPLEVKSAGMAFLGSRYKDRGADWNRRLLVGVSAENQEMLETRLPALLQTHAKTKVLVVSPMLGPVRTTEQHLSGVHWVICGGERGPRARPFQLKWALKLWEMCRSVGVPFYLNRQWSTKLSRHLQSQGVSMKELRQFPSVLKP